MAGEADPALLEENRCRHRLCRENESLAAHSERLRGKFADLIAEAVAEDLGAPRPPCAPASWPPPPRLTWA